MLPIVNGGRDMKETNRPHYHVLVIYPGKDGRLRAYEVGRRKGRARFNSRQAAIQWGNRKYGDKNKGPVKREFTVRQCFRAECAPEIRD